MLKKQLAKKISAALVTILVIALIFSVLLPPAMSISLTIGSISPTDGLTVGDTVTFSNVNITIEAIERIPLVLLNFTIYNNNDQEVTNVEFNIDATNTTNDDYFEVIISPSSLSNLANWYTYGYGYGYDYTEGYDYFWDQDHKGYGYGYGNASLSEITLSYTIGYTTISSGSDFYGKLFANATHNGITKIFSSNRSRTFSVAEPSTPPTPPPSTPDPTNLPPIANAGGPYSGYVGFSITFSGAASSDPDGQITGYRWDFNNDGTYNTDWSTSPTASHIYTQEGTYRVRLQVRDNQGATAVDTATVTVLPATVHKPSNDTLAYLFEQFGIQLTESFQATDTTGDGIVDTFTDPNNMVYLVRTASVEGDVIFLLSTQDGDMPQFFWNSETDEIIPITSTQAETSEPTVNTQTREITFEITVEKADWIYIKLIDSYPLEDYPDFTITVTTSDGRVISPEFIWRENGFIYVLDDPDTTYYFIYNYDVLPDDLRPITTPTTPTEGIPLWIIVVGVIALLIIIIAALFKTGYLYVEKEEQKKPEPTKKPNKKKKKKK